MVDKLFYKKILHGLHENSVLRTGNDMRKLYFIQQKAKQVPSTHGSRRRDYQTRRGRTSGGGPPHPDARPSTLESDSLLRRTTSAPAVPAEENGLNKKSSAFQVFLATT